MSSSQQDKMQPYVSIKLTLKEAPTFKINNKKQDYSSYGYSYRHKDEYSFEELVNDNKSIAIQSTVGYKSHNIINEEVRDSSTIANIKCKFNITDESQELISENIGQIIPTYFSHYPFSDILSVDYNDDYGKSHRKWDLVIYNKDNKFARHTDGKEDECHFGTLLLFPPSDYNKFTGGELVFFQSGKELATLFPHQFNSWTLVAFPINVEHECRPILSGTRYVFKSKLNLPLSYITLHEVKEDALPIPISTKDIQEDIKSYEKEILGYEEKIKQLSETINNIKKMLPTPRIEKIISEISSADSSNIVVVLDRAYDKLDPNYLIGEDRILYNEIVKIYPKTKLIHLDVHLNRGDGDDDGSQSLDFSDESQIGHVIYQKEISNKSMPGSIINQDSVYNDQTYDTIYELKITALSIINLISHKLDENEDEDEDENEDENEDETRESS